jgi:Lar family restriction alleviation protein
MEGWIVSDCAGHGPLPCGPQASFERGFHEAVRRSAHCSHGCRSFSVTLCLGFGEPLDDSLRDCCLRWFREEYPAARSNLVFSAPILPSAGEAVPPCPFCRGLSLEAAGFEDEEGLTLEVVCRDCGANGPIVAGEERRALWAWGLRTLLPRAWLAPSVRGTSYEHPLPPDDASAMRACPFCGQKVLHVGRSGDGWPVQVSCDGCEAGGPSGKDQEIAIRRWNLRG